MCVLYMHIELTYYFQYFTKNEKKKYTTKYRYKGIQHVGLFQETFRKSFAAGVCGIQYHACFPMMIKLSNWSG